MHPEFDRADVVNWLLAHDKITLPAGAGQASLLVRGERGATGRFRLDAPWLGLADDIEGTDRLSGWVADDADADALAALAAGPVGATPDTAHRTGRGSPRGARGRPGDRPALVRIWGPANHAGMAGPPARHHRAHR
ncbi:hypothetical protein [Streptomyces yangpuensis]|uniref:hypothetical protein n=1 Tax=Streptomyces yangpuensis TaxID=1648182 RepID=UPI001F3303A6|nr:hypothetical protein [Streptomyces yangpuensis]